MQKGKNPRLVENEDADAIIEKVKSDIASGKTYTVEVQKFMDLVSGVPGYTVSNLEKQGVINKALRKENLHIRRTTGVVTQFSIDPDDIVSVFWETVMKYLPRAETTGSVVQVRLVDGQDALNKSERQTKCNPINYLRSMGLIGIRNTINKAYRQNLYQVCDDCGHSAAASTSEDNTEACTQCKSENTEKHWPDGNSSYKSAKYRICLDCNSTWQRKFIRKCTECNSIAVRLEHRHNVGIEEEYVNNLPDDDYNLELSSANAEVDKYIHILIAKIGDSLPRDPNNLDGKSRSQDIYSIFTDKERATEVCTLCKSKAQICEQGCTSACDHLKVLDAKKSCGADYFKLNECINYSKKIADFHGCSASLTARRVDKIRKHIVGYITTNRHKDEVCQSLYELIKIRK